MNIEVLELARREFDDAFVHYESLQPGLGEAFRAAIKAQVAKIKAHPDAWMLVRPGIGENLGHRFPYDVIYQRVGDGLLILAVAPKRRAPLYWADRVRK